MAKYLVHYGQIRVSERRIIYRNAIPEVMAETPELAAARVARTFGYRTSESDWVIIDVEEMEEEK